MDRCIPNAPFLQRTVGVNKFKLVDRPIGLFYIPASRLPVFYSLTPKKQFLILVVAGLKLDLELWGGDGHAMYNVIKELGNI